MGDDSHDALNNILAAKGYTTANGMTADGDAAKVYSWNQAEQDTTTYKMSRADDTVEVTNQFDNADLNYYGVDFTYFPAAIGPALTPPALSALMPPMR